MSDSSSGLSHINSAGEANMVDVSAKAVTDRQAQAAAVIRMRPETLRAIQGEYKAADAQSAKLSKGEVLAVARVAGIQAAKRCSDLIPLCHPLALTKVKVDFEVIGDDQLEVRSLCRVSGQTGVEMEALTAVSVAALTVYDMCKAIDKAMVIDGVRLIEKTGGKSGQWKRSEMVDDE